MHLKTIAQLEVLVVRSTRTRNSAEVDIIAGQGRAKQPTFILCLVLVTVPYAVFSAAAGFLAPPLDRDRNTKEISSAWGFLAVLLFLCL
jgi:hypothetical protein